MAADERSVEVEISPTAKRRTCNETCATNSSTKRSVISEASTAATAASFGRVDSPGASYHDYVQQLKVQDGSPVLLAATTPLHLSRKAGSPAVLSMSLTNALRDVQDSLDGFELEPAVDVCRCCGVGTVWVSVECCGDSCCCSHVEWELCETCCETLLHDVCLTKQLDERSQRDEAQTDQTAPTDVSSPGPSEVAPRDASPRFNAQARPFVPQVEASMYYAEQEAYDPSFQWQYYDPSFDPMYMEQYEEPVATVHDLRMMRADMTKICVQFAALGTCPRGNACGWIHCKGLLDK
jgi:hypothetical protein